MGLTGAQGVKGDKGDLGTIVRQALVIGLAYGLKYYEDSLTGIAIVAGNAVLTTQNAVIALPYKVLCGNQLVQGIGDNGALGTFAVIGGAKVKELGIVMLDAGIANEEKPEVASNYTLFFNLAVIKAE